MELTLLHKSINYREQVGADEPMYTTALQGEHAGQRPEAGPQLLRIYNQDLQWRGLVSHHVWPRLASDSPSLLQKSKPGYQGHALRDRVVTQLDRSLILWLVEGLGHLHRSGIREKMMVSTDGQTCRFSRKRSWEFPWKLDMVQGVRPELESHSAFRTHFLGQGF